MGQRGVRSRRIPLLDERFSLLFDRVYPALPEARCWLFGGVLRLRARVEPREVWDKNANVWENGATMAGFKGGVQSRLKGSAGSVKGALADGRGAVMAKFARTHVADRES